MSDNHVLEVMDMKISKKRKDAHGVQKSDILASVSSKSPIVNPTADDAMSYNYDRDVLFDESGDPVSWLEAVLDRED